MFVPKAAKCQKGGGFAKREESRNMRAIKLRGGRARNCKADTHEEKRAVGDPHIHGGRMLKCTLRAQV
jgi:hypothetical protein